MLRIAVTGHRPVSILVLMESGFLPVLTFGIAFATIIAHVFII